MSEEGPISSFFVQHNQSSDCLGSSTLPDENRSSTNFSIFSDLTSNTYEQFLKSGAAHQRHCSDSDPPKNVRKRSLLAKLSFDQIGLVGRGAQIEQIKDIYLNSVVLGKQRALITLVGPSGVGKTSLAETALDEAIASVAPPSLIQSTTSSTSSPGSSTCLWARGKWALTDTNEPLSVVMNLMHQIARQICSHHPDLRERILKEFESEQDTIAAWMPELLQNAECGEEPAAAKAKDTITNYSKAQLRYTTTTLLRMIDFPLAMMLDDIQWAEETTLDLIRYWVTDTSISQLMIVVCYRSEEIDDSHKLTTHFLEPLQEENFQVRETTLEQLTLEQTETFVTILLSINNSRQDTKDFVHFLHRSTAGNPFHLVSFIQSLVEDALISFDLGAMKWVWDLEEIKTNKTITDNVVDMLRKKLMRSSKEARALLPIAATLGAEFSEGILETICEAAAEPDNGIRMSMGTTNNRVSVNSRTSTDSVMMPRSSELSLWLHSMPDPSRLSASLGICELDGFLNHVKAKDETAKYKFVHDRIQEAALSLLPPRDFRNLQCQIGRILAGTILDDDGEVMPYTSDYLIFTAVNLLNAQEPGDITGLSRHHLVCLNFAAGCRATAKTSFARASGYFDTAISLLKEEDWSASSELCAKIYEGAVLAAYSNGNTEMMDKHASIALARQDLDVLCKVPVYHIISQSLKSSEKNHRDALNLDRTLLEQLGVSFPKSSASTMFATLFGLLRSKGVVRKLSDLDVQKLPIVNDQREVAIAKTLDVLITSAYQSKPELIPVAILKMFRQTLRIGLTSYSSVAFGFLGILMAAGLQDFESTKACYNLAWAAQKRVGVTENLPRLYLVSNQIAPWFVQKPDNFREFKRARRLGLLYGDVESSSWATSFAIELGLHLGKPLPLLNEDCIASAKELEDYSMLKQRRQVLWCWQAIRNLCGSDGHGAILTGDIVDYAKEMAHLKDVNDRTMTLGAARAQMFLALSMGNYQLCADIAEEFADEVIKKLPGQAGNIHVPFYAALSCIVLAQRGIQEYKGMGMKYAAIIRSWTKKGNPTCKHLDILLDAEKARLNSRTNKAIANYEAAIESAGHRGFVNLQALAGERYADMLFSLEWNDEGAKRMQEAIKCYREWGATAKVNELEAKLFEYSIQDMNN
ncbi:MAG: hypothetical protein SGILL_005590 [Bacillariaceae sp.]